MRRSFFLLISLLIVHLLTAQKKEVDFWQPISENQVQGNGIRHIVPQKYQCLSLGLNAMKQFLQTLPMEQNTLPPANPVLMSFPMPDGSFSRFMVYESPIMEPGLAAQFPDIKTYAGYGLDDGTATVRFDVTPQGFHAMIISAEKTVFIDPYFFNQTQYYISYFKHDYLNNGKNFDCYVTDGNMPTDEFLPSDMKKKSKIKSLQQINLNSLQASIGPSNNGDPGISVALGNCIKRTYRLALAATGEYTAFHGGTVALAQAAQTTTMNRVNGVYEREIAVRLNIIANNNLIVYTNAASDPYTNGNPGTMIGQNQTNCTNVIGSANYDIGHVFGTNSGGLANLACVCSSNNKARGVTGSSAPVGDPFDIDYVAHEMGHQFGANHTFNGTAGSCAGNGNSSTAYETGSGSTIMGYAGICGAQNVQNNSDDYFHLVSLIEINNFITGSGNSCAATSSLNNTGPTVTSTGGYKMIPISTPFMLTATATDPNALDTLTYCWEQYNSTASTQPPVSTSTAGPNFRSRKPTISNVRYFPRLQDLVTNAATPWEVLSSVTRNFSFRITVRDNHAGGSCNAYDTLTVGVTSTSGPFVVTYPTNTGVSWPGLSTQTVTWNVANTTAAPVSCANVNILLSTDGGYTYPTTLATNVANNGSYAVTVPNTPTTTARIMVKASNNIFFDISNNNFTITAAQVPDYTLSVANSTVSVCKPASATNTINIGQILNYNSPVTLSVSGLPANATSSFSVNPVTPAGSSVLTIGNMANVAVGTYTITVNAVSQSGNKSASFTLNVSDVPAVTTLNTPANGATGVATAPTLTWGAVSGATSYTVQVATDAAFTNVVATGNPATNSYTVSPTLSSSTTYYWRVRAVNSCGNSAYSTVFSFTTGNIVCFTYTSTDVPKTISSNGTPTVNSVLTVPNNGTITDVNVSNLNGTHSYIQDLRFTLRSPANTNVILMDQVCGSQNNFNIKFDDEATNTYANIPCPPTGGGTYQPFQPLSAYDGQTANGTWTLTINDYYNGDGGSLSGWQLYICMSVPCNLNLTTSSVNSSCPSTTNGSATVAVSGGLAPYTYAWSNGATTATASNIAAGTYTVTVTDANTCTASASVTVNSTNPAVTPTISITASQNPICSGNSVTFTATITNGGNSPGYQWRKNGVNIGGATSATYTTTNIANGDVFTCVLTSNAPCANPASVTSNAITMTVNTTATPTISITASQNPICAGTGVTFTSTITNGGSNPAFQWRKNGVNIGGATSATYTTTSLVNGDVISCVLTSNLSCANPTTATSNNITMTVNPVVTPSVSISASQTTICSGASVTFTATPTNGGSPPAYQWKRNGNNVGTNSATYTTTNIADGDVFTCEMTSSAPCATPATVTSNGITMTVNPTVTPTVSISASVTTICPGNSVTFTSTITNGGATPGYQWRKNGVNIGGATSSTYTTSTIANGDVFTCVLTSNATCATPATVTSNAITITVLNNPVPTISISATATTICTGQSVTFSSTIANGGAAPTYQWKKNGVNIGGATNAIYTTSVLTSGDVISCTLTSSLSCASPATANSNNLTITVQPYVQPDVSVTASDNNICSGTSVTFTATPTNGGSSPAYQWQINGVNVGGATSATFSSSALGNNDVVRCVMNSSEPCALPASDTSNVVVMTVAPTVVPSITIVASSTNICSGNPITINSTITNGGNAPAYQWMLNGNNISGATGDSYFTSTLSNGDVISCMLTSSDDCATPATAASNQISFSVTPTVTPTISVNALPGSEVCSADAVTFVSTITNGGASPVYVWKINGNTVGGNTAAYSPSSVNTGDVITCELTSSAVCASPQTVVSQGITMSVKPTPGLPVITSNSPVCGNENLELYTTGISGAAYAWTGPDGFNSIAQNPVVVNPVAGNYTVVITDNGCASPPASITVVVYTPPAAPVVTASGVYLSSNTIAGNQWYLNGSPIGGATSQTYTATQSGWYTVVVTDANGCSEVSNAVFVDMVSVNELAEAGIAVFPNPANEVLQVVIPERLLNSDLVIRLFNDIGQLVEAVKVEQSSTHIGTALFSQGVYFLETDVAGQRYRAKVFVQH